METTTAFCSNTEAMLAGSFLRYKSYIGTGDFKDLIKRVFVGSKRSSDRYRSNTTDLKRYDMDILLDLFKLSSSIPHKCILGESIIEMDYPKSNSLYDLIEFLANMDTTEKVFYIRDNKNISIWVVSTVSDIKTQRQYCHAFAEKVEENFEEDYLFDFRILAPESHTLQALPSTAKLYKRG